MKPHGRSREPFLLGEWEVRPAESLLLRGEETVRLEPRVVGVLLRLAQEAGEVVPRAALLRAVWGDEHAIEEGALPQAIHLIRRALGDDARDPSYVQTVPKLGYRLIAEVRPLDSSSRSFSRRLRGPIMVLVLFGLMAVVFAAYRMNDRGPTSVDEPVRIEILPFSSPSADQLYVVEGLEDSFRGQLSRHAAIRTIDIDPPPADLERETLEARAEEKNLAAILVGVARPQVDPTEIVIEIYRPGKWSRTFSLPLELGSIGTGLDSGVEAVCDALGISPDPSASLGLGDDPEVIGLFFRGLDVLREGPKSPEMAEEGIRYLQQALALDPNHVLSLAILARLYLEGAHQVDRDNAYAKAYALAQQAIAIEPRTAEAHLALMRMMIEYRWDWAAAEHHFQDTIAINPSHWRAFYQQAWFLTLWRNFDRGLIELDRAQSLLPGSRMLQVARVKLLYMAGRYHEAEALARGLLTLEPSPPDIHRALGRVLLELGSVDEAIAVLRLGVEADPGTVLPLSALGHALAVAGETGAAQEILVTLGREHPSRPDRAALVWVGLGRYEEAFAALEAARRLRSPGLVQVGIDPRFQPLHPDARFHELLNQLGLPPLPPEKLATEAVATSLP